MQKLRTDIDVRDSLAKDAADAQRKQGKLPTVVDNSKYLSGVLEKLDREPPKKTPKTDRREDRFDREYRKRCERAGVAYNPNYKIEKSEAPLSMGGQVYKDKVMGTAEKRMRARLRLLRSLPEWRDKLRCINPLALQGHLGEDKKTEAVNAVRKVLHEADLKFGHWAKPPPDRPLWFTK